MDFAQDLQDRLEAIRAQGLYRQLCRVDSPQCPTLRMEGRELLNFSSNDYLGLARHPALKVAARRALADYGVGSGASRLLCGSLAPHHELEEQLAAFKGTEAALAFSSGYATALGVLSALLEKEDIVVLDKKVHACVIDAARLSGAKLRVFAHQDLGDLERILQWARPHRRGESAGGMGSPSRRILVVTESVFSMDGDLAPLQDLVALKEKYGAWLMLDEAHATGLFGAKRRGLAEACGIEGRVEIQMGTLGKALGTAGGYISGSRPLVDLLVNRARSFIFSTAPSPAVSAAATEALRLVQAGEGEERRTRLWRLMDRLKGGLDRAVGLWPAVGSAIVPLRVGGETAAVALADRLRERGIYLPAIRYPTVARGAARLRLTMTSGHRETDVDRLVEELACLKAAFHQET